MVKFFSFIPKQLEESGIWQGGAPGFLSRANLIVHRQGVSAGRKNWGMADAAKNRFFRLFRYISSHRFLFVILSFCAFVFTTSCGCAEEVLTTPAVSTPSMIEQVTAITAMALLPFAVMLLTSYIKIVIVLSLLRNALGVQQSPPNPVLSGVALLMTIYVMFPTMLSMYKASEEFRKEQPPQNLFSGESALYIVSMMDVSKEPLRGFLQRNTSPKHINSFYQLAYRSFPAEFRQNLQPTDFIVLIPSFITSQLKASFEIGVLIYLPFFVIDLVTSNILLAMGMMMLSPLTIALPLKLLLIVMVDGWTLIIQGLVLSFR